MPASASWVTAGIAGRAHGLDGSFHVQRARAELLAVGAEVTVADRPREIIRRAGTDERPIVRLAGCEDRAAAEALRGQELRVAREALPPLREDEWWAEDLEGCQVTDGERKVGRVQGLLALPSCEALKIQRAEGGELLVPLVGDAVRAVDLAARRIDISLEFVEPPGS